MNDNGVTIYAVSDIVSNKQLVAEAVEKEIQRLTNTNTVASSSAITPATTTCTNVRGAGTDRNNSNARATTSGDYCNWDTLPFPYIQSYYHKSYEGTQTGQWYGTSPSIPDKMVFNQVTTVSGLSLTVAWPPSANISGNTSTWQSQPLSGDWYLYVTRPKVEVTSWTSVGLGISVSDTVDIYVPGAIYRPQASFSM